MYAASAWPYDPAPHLTRHFCLSNASSDRPALEPASASRRTPAQLIARFGKVRTGYTLLYMLCLASLSNYCRDTALLHMQHTGSRPTNGPTLVTTPCRARWPGGRWCIASRTQWIVVHALTRPCTTRLSSRAQVIRRTFQQAGVPFAGTPLSLQIANAAPAHPMRMLASSLAAPL